jgi:ArsR family transcriptional regulator
MALKSPLAGPLGQADANELAGVLKALASPPRLMLLSLLSQGESFGEELAAKVGLAQPTVAHHLNVLLSAKLLIQRRDGLYKRVRVRPGALSEIADLLRPETKR